MIKKLLNGFKEKLQYATKPNSYVHQNTIDILYDSQSKTNKLKFFFWKIINVINFLFSSLLTYLIIFYEKFFSKKINNKEFFLRKKNSNKCIIFGNAPSINEFDTNLIDNSFSTFGCNSFYLTDLSKKIDLDYYSSLNTSWLEYIDLHQDENTDLDKVLMKIGKQFSKTKFIFPENYTSKKFKDLIKKNIKYSYFFNFSSLSPLNYFPEKIKFNSHIPHAADVSQLNLILAKSLGFTEIYIEGVEYPFEHNLLEGYLRASDTNKTGSEIERNAFGIKSYLTKDSKLMEKKRKELYDKHEGSFFNYFWWLWFRSSNFFYLYDKFKKKGINIYRTSEAGTLDFIPVKKL
ncbi:MAG: hypothetical protein CBB97_17265 [Candidatus Endolissoclinum sp. TMED37]|nr:MAG: hypothetical protein CBB97_17265 [Candidatus Endolissoclinum sp. TMED37]|tara:strand:+ start:53 stop:1093 length:1041 start_codon:yes stop_codon:yes gene_type:complete